ncbi:hypothetical protein ACX9NE_18700 [Mycobacterium sp. ML4]
MCSAFHLPTGAPPFDDSNSAVVISQHVNAPPPSLESAYPQMAALEWVFAKAMAKDSARRFATCSQFADQLARPPTLDFAYAAEISGEAVPYPHTSVSRTLLVVPVSANPRGVRGRIVLGALLCTALLVAGGVYAG